MQIEIRLVMIVENDEGEPLDYARALGIADLTENAIRNRLFGAGFLPDDVVVDAYTVNAEVKA